MVVFELLENKIKATSHFESVFYLEEYSKQI